jgi:tetratricopeptide (TPR) repeat protein
LAIKEWKYLLDADPNESRIRSRLAMVYFDRNQYRDAVREFTLLSQINQRSAEVYFMLGKSEVLLAAETKDSTEREDLRESAISAFQHALEFDSENIEAKKYLDRLLAVKPAGHKKDIPVKKN